MGIRFYCPNGHKLNVKDFQAGRRGVCPFCGAKMRIPLESTRPSSRRRKSPDGEPAASDTPVDEIQPPSVPARNEPDNFMPPTEPSIAEKGEAIGAAESADPLTEAGEVVWYVRPASGGQFGPANAEVMRTWLAEGRIAAETLVWREGWRDWRAAGEVFARLSQQPSVPGLEGIVPVPVSTVRFRPPSMARTSRNRNSQYIFVGGLILAVVLLFVVLFFVLMNQ